MAIKEIRFVGLDSGSMQYSSIGGIRFYDTDNNIITEGAVITDSATSAETDNFIMTVGSTYAGNDSYYIYNPFNTDNPQTGLDYTQEHYWLSETDNQTITCEFKITIDTISKIDFNPNPSSKTDRGIANDFTIEAYDENNELIHSYSVTPITTNDTVQTLQTEELSKTGAEYSIIKENRNTFTLTDRFQYDKSYQLNYDSNISLGSGINLSKDTGEGEVIIEVPTDGKYKVTNISSITSNESEGIKTHSDTMNNEGEM